MKNLIILLAILSSYITVVAQVSQVDLVQTKGEFTTTSLNLEAGQFQFNISNQNVDHQVGFVLVPKGKYTQGDHLQEAYVKAPVDKGSNSKTSIVTLAAGEYEYFCPLNPTPKYSLVVHDKVETVRLEQTPGKFNKNNLVLSEGAYKFEIHNEGVEHEVGFVLVPQGKYDAANHIKAAYVKAPVPNGSSSETNIIELAAGEYEYFCPLNPTDKYRLTVSK